MFAAKALYDAAQASAAAARERLATAEAAQIAVRRSAHDAAALVTYLTMRVLQRRLESLAGLLRE
jgi:hypothetical protein